MTLQVGKKYRGTITGIIYECLFIGNEQAFLRMSDGRECLLTLNTCKEVFTEQREPQKLVAFVNVYRRDDGKLMYGNIFDTESAALMQNDSKRIATQRIEYTHE